MIAYITGLAEPVYGKEAHAVAMQQMLRIIPGMHVYCRRPDRKQPAGLAGRGVSCAPIPVPTARKR